MNKAIRWYLISFFLFTLFLANCGKNTTIHGSEQNQESFNGHSSEKTKDTEKTSIDSIISHENPFQDNQNDAGTQDRGIISDNTPTKDEPSPQEKSLIETKQPEINNIDKTTNEHFADLHETTSHEIISNDHNTIEQPTNERIAPEPTQEKKPDKSNNFIPTYQQLPPKYKWNHCKTPFTPSTPKEKWKHNITTPLLVTSQGKPNHRGRDVLANPLSKVWFIGKFAYGAFDKDLKDEKIETWIRYQCQQWQKIDTRYSSREKDNKTVDLVQDDGGRVYVRHDLSSQGQQTTYGQIKMLVKGDHSSANFYFDSVKKSQKVVVFDIDGTLTTDDKEMFKQVFTQMFLGKYVPKMYKDADKVVNLYAYKGYHIVYLTGRPDWLTKISRDWLIKTPFARGTLHLTDTNAQFMPKKSGVQKYKTDFLNFLKKSAHVDIVAAYGNSTTDIGAYIAVGIPKNKIFIIGKNAGKQGTQKIKSYTQHIPYVQQLPTAP